MSDQLKDWTIYRITNPNGRIYIGKSCNYTARLRAYKRWHLNKQNIIASSLRKYGFDSHKFDVIDNFNSTGEYASVKEMFWIRTYMSNICKFKDNNGMNMTDGGEGALGTKKSDAFREKMRQYGLGRKQSESQCLAKSILHKGNKYNLGRVQSSEEKEKRALKLRGRKKGKQEWADNKERNICLRGISITINNTDTGEINIFRSQVEAAKYIGVTRDTLRNIMNGGVKSSPYIRNRKYTFKFN